ncbi:hypothetical protein BDN72DRAFT_511952 [Pluteus cervinus]|uniref:Uncharacterized protein n=1 Tax=Pluteus cervinus TaxID=181527 RepID=A0ACD3BE81_9AGAR|nr:hypothetical protein BDN72DRAFT_511952 [Pluteus cervinus]
MPAFQPHGSIKRKQNDTDEENNASRKRFALDSTNSATAYWMVQWRKPQGKKHKTWDGDGVLKSNGKEATLYDMDARMMYTGKVNIPLVEGTNFELGGRELELDRSIAEQEYLTGACFGRFGMDTTPVVRENQPNTTKPFKPLKPSLPTSSISPKQTPIQSELPPSSKNSVQWTANWRKYQPNKSNRVWDGDALVTLAETALTVTDQNGKMMGTTGWNGETLHTGYTFRLSGKEVQLDAPQQAFPDPPPDTNAVSLNKKYVPPASFYASPQAKLKGPRHDPNVEGALVMKAPTDDHSKLHNKHNFPVVPVVVDPVLSKRMRPHQHEGVRFMYESVMGLRRHEGQGCILADDMGLGKTLQTIALIWTLLKQNPYAGPNPAVSKVLIACPVTLINNWKAEFHKWLGRDRIGVVVCDKDKNVIKTFIHSKPQQVLIMSYEKLRTVIEDLTACIPPIGLIVCDEGHKLKSATNKTTSMFKCLRTPRRIILSGTPIQNDLREFHAMADFCNPGLLDDYSTFRRVYEMPILKARSPDATSAEKKLGEARSKQLSSVAQSFVLRRDATLLQSVLPPKHEYVIFVKPTDLQLAIFDKLLQPGQVDDIVQGSTAESLSLINMLTKVSNSPVLLKATVDKAKADSPSTLKPGLESAARLLPTKTHIEDMSLSGKLIIVSRLLRSIREDTEEKCVLVSHYTSTLNILEAYCKKKNYPYYRLDGQTPASKRQEYVNAFNKSSSKGSFVFLLSSKAGGVGINLVGASRLCLLDCDWNPSHDLQSMARCHRDGQKRPVFIYRLLTTGTIDEKIYQRQVTKLGLSDSLMGGANASSSKSDSFSRKELRDIFRIHLQTPSNTHDLLECPQCSCDPDFGRDENLFETDDPRGALGSDLEERGFTVASHVQVRDTDAVDKPETQHKRVALASLGTWKHVNITERLPVDDIQDGVLKDLIQHQYQSQDLKASQESRTSANGTETDTQDERTHLQQLPGGAVTFLFEKTSTTVQSDDQPATEPSPL